MSRYTDMDPIRRQDKDSEAEAAQYAADRRDDYTAARSRCHCGQCGALDGMRAQSYHSVKAIREPGSKYHQVEVWYRWPGDTAYLCCPCWYCNSSGHIPAGYVPLTEFEVDAWLAEQAKVEEA